MTQLRKKMLEEIQRRNYSHRTPQEPTFASSAILRSIFTSHTEFLTGQRLERKELLEDASSAVGKALRHRGYLKAQVTPQLRSLKPSPGSMDAEVALELTIKAGKQYRVKDLTFVGLSGQQAERDLRQACNIRSGEIADRDRAP